MSIEQQTLTGDTVELEDGYRGSHGTMLWCHMCDGWVLRSRRYDHPHTLFDSKADAYSTDESTTWTVESKTGEDYEESEPREVGGEYSVSIHYSATWTATVTVASEDQAVDAAKDEISIVNDAPSTADQVHTDVRLLNTIYEDDEEADDVPGWPL